MTYSPATPPPGREGSIIPAARRGVTPLSISAFLAVLTALALRVAFVHWFPTMTDDSAIYLQLANNWADHHVLGLWLNGQLVPADLRTPGYPAFLAGLTLLFRRSMQAILLSQSVLDVFTCILTAALAAALAPAGSRRRVWIIALWLAAACPFLANYSAAILTETVVTFLVTAALCCFTLGFRENSCSAGVSPAAFFFGGNATPAGETPALQKPFGFALLGAFLTGVASLVRPEMPLLLAVAGLVYGVYEWKARGPRKAAFCAAAMAAVFLLPLLPWAARNAISLHKLQFLAPRYATFPGEYAPVGFYSWTGTWLERYRDVYFTIWAIGEDRMEIDDLPASAFDSPQERAQVADLFAQYNDSPELDVSPELDSQFAELARERTRRHPLRTYIRVPLERALTIWFTPRTELLPIDGKFFPVRQQWNDSHADVLVTGSFAVLGYLYVALAAGGLWLAWRAGAGSSVLLKSNLWGIALIIAYFFIRTAFLTTVEAPEPRYVVSCYPALLALIALLGIRKEEVLGKPS